MNNFFEKTLNRGAAIKPGSEENVSYWKQKLSGLSYLNLPAENKIELNHAAKTALFSQKLSTQLTAAIRKIADQEGVTTFVVLLTAFKLLLRNYTDQDDVCTGTVTLNSSIVNLNLLLDILPVRTNVQNVSFAELLNQVQKELADARLHRIPDFQAFLQTGNLALGEEEQRALFQIMFVADSSTGENDLSLYQEKLLARSAHPEISLIIKDTPAQIQVSIEYLKDAFTNNTVSCMVDHYEQILNIVSKNPQQEVDDIQMLSEAEKHKILVEFNNTATDYSTNKTLAQLFEDQVAANPDAVALIFDKVTCTYRDLNTKANQFAQYLRNSYLIKADDLVGIKLDRSEWMIISILAVLKAGAAYVPIDPALNTARINYIVADSRCKMLIDVKELEKFKTVSKKIFWKKSWFH